MTEFTMHKVGVIPFDIRGDSIAILFVTSQTRGRWILPKGSQKKGETHEVTAKREALEESGVDGDLFLDFPVTVPITKQGSSGMIKTPVTYYPLLISNQYEEWSEKDKRQRHWSLLKNSDKVTDRADFQSLINQFCELSPWILDIAKHRKEVPI